jgi:prepilin-type N-terminal cleavage/methylation domain-containing protein/prepilin-type processing-associated H-X9-DG protein
MNRARGFTLIELMVSIGIIAVLAAILLPVIAKARERARIIVCMSNMRQIGIAFRMYIDDYDGAFPNTGDAYLWMGRRWRWPLAPYLAFTGQRDQAAPTDPNRSVGGMPSILFCPSDSTAPLKWDSTSYGYSAAFYHAPKQVNQMTTDDLTRLDRFPCVTQYEKGVRFADRKALAAEWLTNHDPLPVGWWDWRGSRNYLFVDGRAKYLRATSIHRAVNGWPDINLTRNGLGGYDIE